jgi:hypothetical protein
MGVLGLPRPDPLRSWAIIPHAYSDVQSCTPVRMFEFGWACRGSSGDAPVCTPIQIFEFEPVNRAVFSRSRASESRLCGMPHTRVSDACARARGGRVRARVRARKRGVRRSRFASTRAHVRTWTPARRPPASHICGRNGSRPKYINWPNHLTSGQKVVDWIAAELYPLVQSSDQWSKSGNLDRGRIISIGPIVRWWSNRLKWSNGLRQSGAAQRSARGVAGLGQPACSTRTT